MAGIYDKYIEALDRVKYDQEIDAIKETCRLILEKRLFKKFKIIVGYHATTKNRRALELDSLLVCPLGVFILEYKHYRGTVQLENVNARSLYQIQGGVPREQKNPLFNVRDAVRRLQGPFEKAKVKPPIMGLVLFSHKNSTMELKDDKGRTQEYLASGEVGIGRLSQITDLLEKTAANCGVKINEPYNDLAVKSWLLTLLQDKPGDQKEFPIRRGDFELAEKTDSDPSGINTYRGKTVNTQIPVIVKEYPIDLLIPEADIEKEKQLLIRAHKALAVLGNHPGLVQQMGLYINENDTYVYLAYRDENLLPLADADVSKIDYKTKLHMILELLDTISFVHQNGLIHRGINPYNISLTEHGKTKVGGFDLARIRNDHTLFFIVKKKTGAYVAPEIMNAAKPEDITPTSDLYSLGVFIYWFVTGDNPDIFGPGDFDKLPGKRMAKLVKSLTDPRPDNRLAIKEVIDLVTEELEAVGS